jgi:hypothetical protein
MSTQTIIALVIAAVVVVGGGYFVMNSGGYVLKDDTAASGTMLAGSDKSDNGMVGGDAAAPLQKATTGAFTGSFFDLATRGGNYKCMVESNGTAVGTTGTVYVSGTDLRGDFNSLVNGKAVESHMLKKADQIYVWSSLMPQGVTMKAVAMEGQGGAATQGSGVTGTQSYAWNCAATGTDASMFALPGGIKFMDVSAMMGGSVPAAGMMPKIPTN